MASSVSTTTKGEKPKRGQANRRERVRTENVNAGFGCLRQLIPTDPIDRKLSKIEVLRLATSYINHLSNLTKANSCAEAEARHRRLRRPSCGSSNDLTTRQDVGDCKSQGGSHGNLSSCVYDKTIAKRRTLNHVCTFCLMMTKSFSGSPVSLSKRK